MSRLLTRLKSWDYFKKLPSDLTEPTLTGAWLSILATVIMAFLLGMEFVSFFSLSTETALVVDRSPPNELLKVNFNISFPAMSCEFATLDVSDSLGTRRMNLTKTVRKVPIKLDLSHAGVATDASSHKVGPKYDQEGTMDSQLLDVDVTKPLTSEEFQVAIARYPIVVINFYAPWCHWCRRLEPSWEAASKEIHDKYPESDGRIRFGKIDCTIETEICRAMYIQGFPSMRVFRRGKDDIYVNGYHAHESYTGDRTKEALVRFADQLVPSAGQPHLKHANLVSAPQSSGCNMAGFVMVKKVPGTLYFHSKLDGFDFDHNTMNLTHVVHGFAFGARPSVKKYQLLQRLHPAGLSANWADKLHDQLFVSEHSQSTHEHYLQVVLTTIEPQGAAKGSGYDAYEYTAHSYSFITDQLPAVRLTYDVSPIQIVVRETRKAWYKLVGTVCVIMACVFTVAQMLDAVFHTGMKAIKKVNLGKQG